MTDIAGITAFFVLMFPYVFRWDFIGRRQPRFCNRVKRLSISGIGIGSKEKVFPVFEATSWSDPAAVVEK
ncbi:hypothetical protein LMZ02_10855 [Paenibacillus macerans]|uniref:hypothetical protein n=1 Tax=Paenibacillus macerans TaxID=44252 RepID=UPI0012D86991|nr:hypothetical protein [Paenibacillus macerans]UMV49813.1 hypothetical protein LMZ02_10855 [Paenibacillus macerans]